ncbi:unnamed protein product [Acanthoscelides obtectus]|uniref:Transposase n=1 Tax=Acanthoscelides obtectus TaxID=200917 RepID=A0A9P0PUI0_ACAOB|nr:unnamed protein product [Acanthoscelides obtectus]CAK1649086.1 Histone-lysine N-methyltransferase SETMAR [Acanthoscelides obtectus]
MELGREHFRAIIYYNFQRQLSQQECLAELLSAFGNEAPHQSTISRWYGEFKRGRVSLSDEPRVGAPKTAVTQEYVDAVRKLIIEDRHVTYREIEAKLVSRWIPLLLSEEQKAARVNWCQKTLDQNKRQSAVWVFQVITELQKIHPERRIILHQDNASSHTAQKTRQYLTEENVELLDHPPYSPDLNPNDSFTFPKIKNRLRGQRFQSPEEAVDEFKDAVLDLPANEWDKCFENWFQKVKFPASIMDFILLMEMWIQANILAILEESLLPVMEECLTSGQDFVFQQDGATCYTSKKAIRWMEENNVPFLKWVSSSPDLSPIETLWHEMKKVLRQHPARNAYSLIENYLSNRPQSVQISGSHLPNYTNSSFNINDQKMQINRVPNIKYLGVLYFLHSITRYHTFLNPDQKIKHNYYTRYKILQQSYLYLATKLYEIIPKDLKDLNFKRDLEKWLHSISRTEIHKLINTNIK